MIYDFRTAGSVGARRLWLIVRSSPRDRLHLIPPHPGPLPRGEGESSAVCWHSRDGVCRAGMRRTRPRAAAVPSPRGRVSVYRGRDSALRCPRRVQRRFNMAKPARPAKCSARCTRAGTPQRGVPTYQLCSDGKHIPPAGRGNSEHRAPEIREIWIALRVLAGAAPRVLPASRRQAFRSRIVSFAGKMPAAHLNQTFSGTTNGLR